MDSETILDPNLLSVYDHDSKFLDCYEPQGELSSPIDDFTEEFIKFFCNEED